MKYQSKFMLVQMFIQGQQNCMISLLTHIRNKFLASANAP